MNTQSIYNGLDYTTKEINRNFKIKVNGIVNGKKVNVLVGVSGLIKIVGDIKLVNRLLKRAFNCYGDKEVCKLRRGVGLSGYGGQRHDLTIYFPGFPGYIIPVFRLVYRAHRYRWTGN